MTLGRKSIRMIAEKNEEPSRPRVPTRAHQAGLRLEDVPRASLAKIARQRRLDAQVRRALGLVLRRRPKRPR